MSERSWEYLTDREDITGGMAPDLVGEVELLAQRLADASSVKYVGEPGVEDSVVSGLLTLAEGRWMVWYQEDWRHCIVYIIRVVYWPA